MERSEIIGFLREHLRVEVSMGMEHECESSYVTCSVSLQIDGEEISSSYDSVNVSR